MSLRESPIHHVLDMSRWQAVQDALADSTRMAIITVDYRGAPVTAHSGCSAFCSRIREDARFRPHCLKCDSRGGLEAARTNRPYIYFCHFGIIDVAIPIIVDDLYIGAVMAGQVRLSDSEREEGLERMIGGTDPQETARMRASLDAEFDAIPTLSFEQVRTASEMLFRLCGYIVDQAAEKQQAIDMARSVLGDAPAQNRARGGAGYGVERIRRIHREMAGTLIDAFISGTFQNRNERVSPLLQPAIDYIFVHKSERITLGQLADLCHVSPSYFSRMFRQETGENLSAFLVRLKVMFARQLLQTTDLSIQQVAESLGFNETGYFIRRFKALAGTTPASYRRSLQKADA